MPIAPRVRLPPGIAPTPIILLSPRMLIPIGTLSPPIMLIRKGFNLCRSRRRKGRPPAQAGQQQSDADERHVMSHRVSDGAHVVCLRAERPARLSTAITGS